MVSFGIIVFREMLEISLMLSILLAGTRTVSGRKFWIWLGIIGGLAGSIGVALSMEQISQLMEGFGQEVFNATILIVAAVLIGSTVVWMKRHARDIAKHLKDVSAEVSYGKRPLYALAVVVALTILRDGSEIVLLAQGIMVSATSYSSLAIGGFCGLMVGGLVGYGIYIGLIRSATRYLFEVTTWLLVLLCAGMISQGIGLLASADIVPYLSHTLWDSSAILSENSMFGETLHILLGYTSRPSAMQVLCYLSTILLVSFAMYWHGRSLAVSARVDKAASKAAAVAIMVFAVAFGVCGQTAYAIDKVYSPIVEEGELELETRGTYAFDSDDEKDGAYKQRFGIGYGFTDRFAGELYGIIVDSSDEDLEFEAVSAEGRYQLFDQGEYWLDAGLYLEYEFEIEEEEHKMEGKLLLEKSNSEFVNTLNLVLEREVFGSGGEEWEGEFRGHSLYRYSQAFEPGVEIQSGLGDLDDMGSFDDQDHNIGPVVHGKVDSVGYALAGLFGVSDAAADFTLRWELELEL